MNTNLNRTQISKPRNISLPNNSDFQNYQYIMHNKPENYNLAYDNLLQLQVQRNNIQIYEAQVLAFLKQKKEFTKNQSSFSNSPLIKKEKRQTLKNQLEENRKKLINLSRIQNAENIQELSLNPIQAKMVPVRTKQYEEIQDKYLIMPKIDDNLVEKSDYRDDSPKMMRKDGVTHYSNHYSESTTNPSPLIHKDIEDHLISHSSRIYSAKIKQQIIRDQSQRQQHSMVNHQSIHFDTKVNYQLQSERSQIHTNMNDINNINYDSDIIKLQDSAHLFDKENSDLNRYKKNISFSPPIKKYKQLENQNFTKKISNSFSVRRSFSVKKCIQKTQNENIIQEIAFMCTQNKYTDLRNKKKQIENPKQQQFRQRQMSVKGKNSAQSTTKSPGRIQKIQLPTDISTGELSEFSVDSDEEELDDDQMSENPQNQQNNTLNQLPTRASNQNSSNNTDSNAQKLLLLPSVYENRPATIYFPYPIQSERTREISRTFTTNDLEQKKYQFSYKIMANTSPYKALVNTFAAAGIPEIDDYETTWNICWGYGKQNHVKQLLRYQKINHFPGCCHLGRKDFLWRNLSKTKRKFPQDYDFVPNTYLLSSQADWERFMVKQETADKNHLWIMKPVHGAQGRGIKMVSKKTKVSKKSDYLICEYLADPHLIDGLKYDLRIYVCVTSFNPLRVYLFEEGLARFATEKYTTNLNQLSKRYVHLTNYSVNKNSKQFVKNKDPHKDDIGSKWSLTALKRKYAELGIDVSNFLKKVQDLIIKTLISAEPHMQDIFSYSSEHRNNCFEIYGFDILVDNNIKPWLIEVNVQPSLSSSSPLDRRIKHTLICDSFNLIGLVPYDKKKFEEDLKKKLLGQGDQRKKQFSRNINDIGDLDSKNCFQKLLIDDWKILFETDEEYYRKGNYTRIFPIQSKQQMKYYLNFFEYNRYNNLIVEKWINSSTNFLEQVLKKKFHDTL